MQRNNGVANRPSEHVGVLWLIPYWIVTSCVAIALVSCTSLSASSIPEKNVLVLCSWPLRSAFGELGALEDTVRFRIEAPVDFYVEYLESQRFGSAEYQKTLIETIRQLYRGRQFDLIVVASYPALQFAIDHREQLFPGIPIVFITVPPGRLPDGVPWPGVTGVTLNVDVRGSIDLALRLHPDTQNVALVAGSSEFEQYWMEVLRNELRQREDKLTRIEMSTASTQQLLEQASTLPSHTIVFFDLIPRESSHQEIGVYPVLETIAQRFPTYCIINYCLGHGAVGGSYPDPNISGVLGGELAARILSGEKPESIPVAKDSISHLQVDWRELRRWKIPESALPPGTLILYREPTVWQKHKTFIVAAVVVIVVLGLLIFALLRLRARRLKSDVSLRESEKRFRVMADTTPYLVWMCDRNGKVTYLNETRIEFTGGDPTAGLGDRWLSFIHPDDLENVRTASSRALEEQKGFSREYRLRRKDGVYRWILDVAAPRINADGSFAGFIGSANDVTDQKLAQEALEKVGGRLIEAQEKERSRIARDLHDDICQSLALISLELHQASQESNGTDARTKERILQIQKHCSEIAGDVQSLSHQLHSPKLDYLGLVAALGSFCREFSEHHNVQVEFTEEDVPKTLPKDVSLTLFRVTQEALQNALKYSGVSQFSVDLRRRADRLSLEITDAGVGFIVEEAKRDRGLGLVSMQERVHLVNGTFSLQSKVNRGTKIVVFVPLVAEMKASAMDTGNS
jgi:PAS domain S-box-containing protein